MEVIYLEEKALRQPVEKLVQRVKGKKSISQVRQMDLS
jgi:hypothetical protein